MCEAPDDGNDVETYDWVTARRARRCSGCAETINAGDRYCRIKVLAEGYWSRYDHCSRCHRMFLAIAKHTGEPVLFDLNCGETWEDPPPDVARLAFLTREEAQRELGGRDG